MLDDSLLFCYVAPLAWCVCAGMFSVLPSGTVRMLLGSFLVAAAFFHGAFQLASRSKRYCAAKASAIVEESGSSTNKRLGLEQGLTSMPKSNEAIRHVLAWKGTSVYNWTQRAIILVFCIYVAVDRDFGIGLLAILFGILLGVGGGIDWFAREVLEWNVVDEKLICRDVRSNRLITVELIRLDYWNESMELVDANGVTSKWSVRSWTSPARLAVDLMLISRGRAKVLLA